MTDLEMVKLCAEALDLPYRIIENITEHVWIDDGRIPNDSYEYDPLHDDAQCFALVKLFGVHVGKVGDFGRLANQWSACVPLSEVDTVFAPDLNRAIVECVAKMQRSNHDR